MKLFDFGLVFLFGFAISFIVMPLIINGGSTQFVSTGGKIGIPQKCNGGYVVVTDVTEREYLEYEKTLSIKEFDDKLKELGK
jgi:hypothetical protein